MAPCFNEFFPLIKYYKKNNSFVPIVYFNHSVAHARHQMVQCLDNNIVALDEFANVINVGEENCKEIAKARKSNVVIFLLKKIYRTFSTPLYNPFIDLKYLIKRDVVLNKILKNYKPSAIVLGADMAHLDTSLIVKTARKKGIPCITLTWIFASGDDPANVYFNKNVYGEYQGNILINRLLLKLFPKYQYTYRGIVLSRLPAMQAFVREALCLGVPKPWVMNSGYCKSVLVESDAMFDFYQKAGLPIQQLKNIGSPIQDILSYQLQNKSTLKEKLYRDYCFDENKPLLVTGIIPNCFEMLRGQTEALEFGNYEELQDFWIKKIKTLNDKYNILATIHPGENQETRDSLEKIYGIKIIKTSESTAEIIPLSDLYITSVSSTIRWAIACRVPVLDFDFYNFDNQLGEVAGVVKVSSKDDFEKKLNLILNGTLFSVDLNGELGDSLRFGLLDGGACHRISSHINELINEKN